MLSPANITEITSNGKASPDEISNLYKLRIAEGDDALGISGNRLDVTTFLNQNWIDNIVPQAVQNSAIPPKSTSLYSHRLAL